MWQTVADCIDDDTFGYGCSGGAGQRFAASTHLLWNALEETIDNAMVVCWFCDAKATVPYTTLAGKPRYKSPTQNPSTDLDDWAVATPTSGQDVAITKKT